MAAKKLDVDDRELIWAAKQLGWSAERIAAYFDVEPRTVYRVLNEITREHGSLSCVRQFARPGSEASPGRVFPSRVPR